jgi:hypothetical protein
MQVRPRRDDAGIPIDGEPMPQHESGLEDAAASTKPGNLVCPATDTFPLHQAALQSKARLRYLTERLHTLGPKPLFHFLDEVERGADLRAHLEAYAELPGDFIRANGGDQFAAPFIIDGRLL